MTWQNKIFYLQNILDDIRLFLLNVLHLTQKVREFFANILFQFYLSEDEGGLFSPLFIVENFLSRRQDPHKKGKVKFKIIPWPPVRSRPQSSYNFDESLRFCAKGQGDIVRSPNKHLPILFDSVHMSGVFQIGLKVRNKHLQHILNVEK
ncbi:hypothetical protein C8_454 [Cannes 8 virus]|nr:hypothetical protein C8_454 [Cannes 8 virus]